MTELFANQPTTTVPSSQSTASTLWTVQSSLTFPIVSSGLSQFHVADAATAASSEIIKVTNTASNVWTVVRGAEGTTPVAHAAGATVVQVITAGWLNNIAPSANFAWFNVQNYGADPTGTADSTTAIQAAWTAAVAAGAGMVYYPSGTYRQNSTVTAQLGGASVTAWFDPGAKVMFYGSGDCLRIYDSSTYDTRTAQRAGIDGFGVIDGTHSSSGSACSAVHIGDIVQLIMNVSVTHWFNNAGSKGVWLDNNYYWTEQAYGRIYALSGATGVQFDNSVNTSGSSTGSFERLQLDIFLDANGVGDGVTFANGAFVSDGSLGIYGNFVTSPTQYAVLRITGSNTGNSSNIANAELRIGVELDDDVNLPPYTIYFGGGGNSVYKCTGYMDFSQGSAFTGSNNGGRFLFTGPVYGDANLYPVANLDAQPYTQAITGNGQTVSTGWVGRFQLTGSGGYTGLVLSPGGFQGQQATLVNVSSGSLTFATAGTSNVANGTGDVIAVNTAHRYTWDASSSLWYADAGTGAGSQTASFLADLSGSVNVGLATAPTAGQVLTATSGTTATWQPGTASSTANFLADLSGNVNVSLASAPTSGQVLTATSGTTATWQPSAGNTLTRHLWTVPSPGATYTAATWELTAVSTSSGSGTVVLPTAPAAMSGTQNAVKQIILGGGNQVTIQTQGSDVFSFTGGSTANTLNLAGQASLLQYDGTSIWTVIADDLAAASVVNLGADIGGTNIAPLVQSTHLTVSTNTAASGTVNLNATSTRVFNITQSGAATFTFTSSGLSAATAYGFEMYLNPGTFTTAWPGSVTWLGPGTAPALTPGTVNTLVFETVNQGTTWYGAAVQDAPSLPLVVAEGGTGGMAFAPYAVVTGGTGTAGTTTGPLQNVSGVGTSGQILTSNGSGALPTWQESPGVSGVTANSLGLGLLTMQPHAAGLAAGSAPPVPAQDILFVLCTAAQSQTVSHLGAFVAQAGATTGAGLNAMALYSAAGTLLQNTGDMTAAFTVATAYAEGTLGTAATIVQGTNYYIAVIANFTGTQLRLGGQAAISANVEAINGNYLSCVLASQTSWPGSFTPSAATKNTNLPLMYAR